MTQRPEDMVSDRDSGLKVETGPEAGAAGAEEGHFAAIAEVPEAVKGRPSILCYLKWIVLAWLVVLAVLLTAALAFGFFLTPVWLLVLIPGKLAWWGYLIGQLAGIAAVAVLICYVCEQGREELGPFI